MSSDETRIRVAGRAAAVRTWALFAFFVALAVRPGVEIVYGTQPSGSGLGYTLDATFSLTMSAAIGVFVVAQVVLLVLAAIDRGRSRNERPLPAFGRWSRTVCEISTTIVLAGLLMAVFLPMTWSESTPTRVVGDEGPLVAAVRQGASDLAAGSLLLALASAVLWLVAEGVAGYQEPRSAPSSPGSVSQDTRHQLT